MPRINSHGVSLYYEQYGARANPTVLLIHGLMCQLIHWPRRLIDALTGAGYRVVAFDNRDVGLSGKLDDCPAGTLEEVLADPRAFDPPYGLHDMAQDAVALLDYLGQSGAHVVGFSMGGMIAQRMALDFPERMFSLTSMMSSTSDRDLPGGQRAAFSAFASTAPAARQDAIAHLAHGWQVLGGPHYSSNELGLGRLAEAAWERGYSAAGAARQLLAILHAEPRGDALEALDLPALVIHGAKDPMVPAAAAERTAACLKGSRLAVFEQLGHDLPEPLLDDIAAAIVNHLDAVPLAR